MTSTMKYHVVYFYLATGMEGIPDKEDIGWIEAESQNGAKEKASLIKYPEDIMYGPNKSYSTRDFYKGCLSVSENGFYWKSNRWHEMPIFSDFHEWYESIWNEDHTEELKNLLFAAYKLGRKRK